MDQELNGLKTADEIVEETTPTVSDEEIGANAEFVPEEESIIEEETPVVEEEAPTVEEESIVE